MKICDVKAYAVRIPRNIKGALGTAGLPAPLTGVESTDNSGQPSFTFKWAEANQTIYSTGIETTLVKVETDTGIVGWGESQSPVAPEITRTIIETLLRPIVIGEDAGAPEILWSRMYQAMRVRGHTGSFLLDAIAGIDIALWDICGKACEQPVCRLFGGSPLLQIPTYISGLEGDDLHSRLSYAQSQVAAGATRFKIFLDTTQGDCLRLIDRLREEYSEEIEICVDALWRLSLKSALGFARQLESRRVGWLEAPLKPEDVRGHGRLAANSPIPIAIGESYRTRYEVLPFFEVGGVDMLQPDIGRSGLTEGRKLSVLADTFHTPVAPHVSIGLGPQIAAALHLSAACVNLHSIECNPQVYVVANQFLTEPLRFTGSTISVPCNGGGLGIQVNEQALQEFVAP
ncbi:MAG TPA: mandelate racemase/muconate lactonizing enzyme family protein [Pyrinomonadaceae bacterium]|jgi:galactonate dehydratase